jgi:TolA-binding protein
MRRALSGSLVLAVVGIAALEAQPPTPTRTPATARSSPGDGSAPLRSDSTPGPRAAPPAQIISDVSAQYDSLERSIGETYQKLISEQKGEIEELQAEIAAVKEQLRQLHEAQEKLKKMAAAIQTLEQQQAAANLSKKIDTLEVKAQRIKASLMMRTPVRKTRTPTPPSPYPSPPEGKRG